MRRFPIEKRFLHFKKKRRPFAVLTAYDALTASLLIRSGIDFLLVGDSVATVLLGYERTTDISMDEMIHHCRAVRRGAGKKAWVIGDMPYEGCRGKDSQAIQSARRFVCEGGCDAVKLEWNSKAARLTRELVKLGIPVMGHVGLTPQSVKAGKRFTVQGITAQTARTIARQAVEFQKQGASSIILECVPDKLATWITRHLRIPTVGIGAGKHCDGQVLVFHDLIGFSLYPKRFKFVRRYAETGNTTLKAVEKFIQDVRQKRFPSEAETFHMPKIEWEIFNRRHKSLLKR